MTRQRAFKKTYSGFEEPDAQLFEHHSLVPEIVLFSCQSSSFKLELTYVKPIASAWNFSAIMPSRTGLITEI